MARHLAICSVTIYSHHRDLLGFAASLIAHSSDLIVTHFVPEELQEATERILERFELDTEQRSRLRLVWTDPGKVSNPDGRRRGRSFGCAQIVIDEGYYQQLIDGEAMQGHAALPPPKAILADSLAYKLIDHAKEQGYSGLTMFFLAFEPFASLSFFACLETAIRSGEDALIEEEGLPPRYVYELKPATTALEPSKELINPTWVEFLKSTTSGEHRAIMAFSRELVPGGAKALNDKRKDWAMVVGIHAYRPTFWQPSVPSFPSGEPFDWLNKQPDKSVMYISFGSLFFPGSVPWHLDVLVDSLVAAGQRFLLIIGSFTAKLADPAIIARAEENARSSGLGLTQSWVPQELVLRHPAISYTLHQGGAGSIIESFQNGLPSVVWPFFTDQTTNATTIADRLDAGLQLWETRDRLVGRPLGSKHGYLVKGTQASLREELDRVLKAMQGEEGERKRRNAQAAGELLRGEYRDKAGPYLDEFLTLF